MDKTKNFLILIFILLTLSCHNEYDISKDGLTSRFKITNGFRISELNVQTLNDVGVPEEYDIMYTARYIASHEDLSKKRGFCKFEFEDVHGKENYKWIWRIDSIKSYTIPIQFKNNIWYLFDLSNESCKVDNVYVKFSEDGSVEQHHRYGNCGAAW